MKIYFLRHGIAVEPGDWKRSDYDRPLTSEGRDRMAQEARAFRKMGLKLDAILTSPLVRAKETAAIMASELRMVSKEDERLGGDFDVSALEEILKGCADLKTLMVVGHEPSFSAVVGRLIGEGRLELKKGGVACVELPDPSTMTGELHFLIPPKVLLL
ncbi:MAG TPA: phosphohistidine phosphatase SixA [Candidatus Rubrimentiphilum sp.]|nr:phosphohistidine phosphatase SixA [Candidatus Rubrimentiphilum sp.]